MIIDYNTCYMHICITMSYVCMCIHLCHERYMTRQVSDESHTLALTQKRRDETPVPSHGDRDPCLLLASLTY